MSLSNQELGLYLKNLREKKGLSTRQVFEISGVSNGYLSLIEHGKRKASAIVLKKLAPFYDISYIDLYEKAGYIDLIEISNDGNNSLLSSENQSKSAVVFIYGTIPAGIPMECIEDIIGTEEISVDMLNGGKQYFGLKVKGNSMNPDYSDSDILIIEKVEDCESGQDCIVMVNGDDGTFKRVFKNPETKSITLWPLNTSLDENGKPLYEPKTYTEEQIINLPVKIIGRVVELRRKK